MKTFVVLAAGRGSRVGRPIHKALLPLSGEAVLSRIIGLRPPGSSVVVCVGHQSEQIREYLGSAHPELDVTFVDVEGWDGPSGGPGWSLLSARDHVEGDMVFTTCDTLWSPMPWDVEGSWLGVAPVPSGTPEARWCRVMPDGTIVDKRPTPAGGAVHTGMGQIAEADLPAFWDGIRGSSTVQGETQMSGGFKAVPNLGSRLIGWTDVGDAEAYSRAVLLESGFDWSKPEEATYLLPDRVVKLWPDDGGKPKQMADRSFGLSTPRILRVGDYTLTMERVPGVSPYDRLSTVPMVLEWARELWTPRPDSEAFRAAVWSFYHDKTYSRVDQLRPELRARATDAVSRVDWDWLLEGARPATIHGDLMFGNILVSERSVHAIDWRPDFAGLDYGDIRYDLAKLLSGCRVHWENARHGDFRLAGLEREERMVLDLAVELGIDPVAVETLAALVFLNSAPLHKSPFDEILVWRGTAWLERLTFTS